VVAPSSVAHVARSVDAERVVGLGAERHGEPHALIQTVSSNAEAIQRPQRQTAAA